MMRSNVLGAPSYADVVRGGFNNNVTHSPTPTSVSSASGRVFIIPQQERHTAEVPEVRNNTEFSQSSLFSKFKALLCKVAQAPVALASKIGRVLKTTTEHTITWATFRKVLVRVTCVATIIGISGTVAAMTANPVLGGTVGVLLGAAGQEILNTSVNAFINEGVFA